MMKRKFASSAAFVAVATALVVLFSGFHPSNAQTATPTSVFPVTNTPRPSSTPGSMWDLFPPTNTPRAVASATSIPSATITLAITSTFAPPTFTPEGVAGATWTPPAADPASQILDHYYMERPIGDNDINYQAWTYPYGGTSGGRLQVHHGIDLVNGTGTPVLAVADGTVVYAGNDLSTLLGPYNNYYGNVVVIQHHFVDTSGGTVFTLYGHLDRVEVTSGQAVTSGQPIATVGGTGIAQGPHLHFEVRVGNAFDFGATRNPALWIRPYFTFGTLAGRISDASGTLLYDASIVVTPSGGAEGATRYAFSYTDNTVNGDSTFGENWVLGDLPAGYYTVTVSDNGRVRFRETVYATQNRTTWVDIVLN